MIFKILTFAAVIMVCQGTIPDQFFYRRIPPRFLFNNQGMRQPGSPWNYQIINGRPVISGYPNGNSYVAFGLNPQTGQIEQTQIITQTRPGGPFLNLVQNMLNVAGQFFGQLTGAVGNAVGGAMQSAGQFGQDIQDLSKPVISVTGVSQTSGDSEPFQQLGQSGSQGFYRPTAPTPVETTPTPSTETVPEQAKSDIQPVDSILDQAIISIQTFRTNIQANFESNFEGEEGENAWNKVNENIDWAVNTLQDLKESTDVEANSVLQSGQNAVNTAFDNIETAVEGVTGTQGRNFIEPTKNELNKLFNDALNFYKTSVTSVAEISPAK